jgi:flagellar basal body-associated protein FliL
MKLKTESGMILFMVLMVVIIMMIIAAAILSQSMNESQMAYQQAETIRKEQLGKGIWWQLYSTQSFAAEAAKGPSTRLINGKNYTVNVRSLGNKQFSVEVSDP